MCVLRNPTAPTASAPPGLFTHLLAQYAQREQAAPLGPAVSGHREVVDSQGARVAIGPRHRPDRAATNSVWGGRWGARGSAGGNAPHHPGAHQTQPQHQGLQGQAPL